VDLLGICMNINGWEGMIFVSLNTAIAPRPGRWRELWLADV
jgi:MATE family multidrug resistance protein